MKKILYNGPYNEMYEDIAEVFLEDFPNVKYHSLQEGNNLIITVEGSKKDLSKLEKEIAETYDTKVFLMKKADECKRKTGKNFIK